MGQLKRDCPHCHTKNSAFMAFGEKQQIDSELWTTALFCSGCYGGMTAIIEMQAGQTPLGYPGDIDQNPNLMIQAEYPRHEPKEAPRHLPANIESYFLQATRSLEGKNFDASGVMSRKALDTATRKLKPDAKGNLYKRIEALAAVNLITPDLKNWAHIIRDDGNDAAHEEEPTTQDFAQELLDFTELFLMYTFTMPGMVKDRQQDDSNEGQQNAEAEGG